MRDLTRLIAIVVIISGAALAQETPKFESFLGYSYLRSDAQSFGAPDNLDLHGWNAAFQFNANKWLGIKADFSGHYEPDSAMDSNQHSFLAGPVFTLCGDCFSPFTHVLIGAVRNETSGQDDTGFGMAAGGGLDINVNRRVAFRFFQADYLMGNSFDQTQNNSRLALRELRNSYGRLPNC